MSMKLALVQFTLNALALTTPPGVIVGLLVETAEVSCSFAMYA